MLVHMWVVVCFCYACTRVGGSVLLLCMYTCICVVVCLCYACTHVFEWSCACAMHVRFMLKYILLVSELSGQS